MLSKKLFSLSLSLGLVIVLAGCAKTAISPNAFPGRPKAAAYIEHPSASYVCLTGVPESLGYQYGLVLLPLGIIVGGELATNRITDEVVVAAARKGVKLVYDQGRCGGITPTPESPGPDLTIELTEVTLNASDFVFLRRVSASISGILRHSHLAAAWRFEAKSSSWRRFGFKSQLDAEFHRTTAQAFDKVPFEKFRSLR